MEVRCKNRPFSSKSLCANGEFTLTFAFQNLTRKHKNNKLLDTKLNLNADSYNNRPPQNYLQPRNYENLIKS